MIVTYLVVSKQELMMSMTVWMKAFSLSVTGNPLVLVVVWYVVGGVIIYRNE